MRLRFFIAALALLCALPDAAVARRRHHIAQPWCGTFMMKHFGKTDPNLAVAANWRFEGTAAAGPAIGVVVVWPHHVGLIVGQNERGEWLILSGNDGNAVRTRVWNLRGVIAWRYV